MADLNRARVLEVLEVGGMGRAVEIVNQMPCHNGQISKERFISRLKDANKLVDGEPLGFAIEEVSKLGTHADYAGYWTEY